MTRVLVTGASGFLGRAVCRVLLRHGYAVRGFQRHHHPALHHLGVEQVLGDLRDPDHVHRAVDGCAAVVHTAAKAGHWGKAEEYHQINAGGTDHVLDACRAHGVDRLVHTSSPAVVHRGRDLDGVDESVPYATRFRSPYPASKAIAEQHVLAANSPTLATVALRPHLIWGPEDPHFLPRLTAQARAGRLRHLGRTSKKIDTVHVVNAARAHLLALQRLTPGAPIAGKAYFITQGHPLPVDLVINGLLIAAGLPPEQRRVPRPPARLAGTAVELAFRLTNRAAEPPITRFLMDQLGTAHWFDITAARTDLGYHPEVGLLEGLAELAGWIASTGRKGEGAAVEGATT
ncbi:nucleoside-diphosphate-sugar epimerase [Saccharothrix tamanrassetensis]|uniref:Nucleoside-diphosphate-sugar epimerase n=1 Tax=Saccharothrix tamanrassetensis TaxID=1051531 RepID=A0A841CJ38_9PSEU|nr:NAD-dependent epimerase/dehydratase family protein [Saccharothrix tamanrassetensis]MBB5957319.1 nucleoside-diphosphate-sugar epimerase [Saccharothrix tamanrassetensis]